MDYLAIEEVYVPTANPIKHTQQPIVTGTSVLGIRFKDGVMLAADTLASYGSLAQIRDMERLAQFGSNTCIGASGDMSDWQELQHELKKQILAESRMDDGHELAPEHIYEFLARLMYSRRSNVNPLWNSLVVAGCRQNKPFLGYVDLKGTTYSASTIATGYGAYIAQPLLRKHVEGREETLTEAEATRILEESMRVLFYRDARSLNRIQRAVITNEGVTITEPYSLKTEWGFGDMVRGYGAVYNPRS